MKTGCNTLAMKKANAVTCFQSSAALGPTHSSVAQPNHRAHLLCNWTNHKQHYKKKGKIQMSSKISNNMQPISQQACANAKQEQSSQEWN